MLSREFTTRSKTVCYRKKWNKIDIGTNRKLHVCLSKQSYGLPVAKIWEWYVSPWCNLQDDTLGVAIAFSCSKNQCRLPSRSSFPNWGRNKRKHNSRLWQKSKNGIQILTHFTQWSTAAPRKLIHWKHLIQVNDRNNTNAALISATSLLYFWDHIILSKNNHLGGTLMEIRFWKPF